MVGAPEEESEQDEEVDVKIQKHNGGQVMATTTVERRQDMQGKVSTPIDCATRIPLVAEQVQRMEKSIARLGEACAQVEGRIEGILMPANPSPSNPQGPSELRPDRPVFLPPLAQDLERLTAHANEIAEMVENMLSRVEL